MGNRAVGSVNEAVAAIRSATQDAHAVALRIQRDGHSAFVAVNLDKAPSLDKQPSQNDDADNG